MKQFFTVTFGGLAAIGTGMALAYLAHSAWLTFQPSLAQLSIPSLKSVAASMVSQPTDGTSISGMARTVRFTATEEEDAINAAAQSLPAGSDKNITATAYLVTDFTHGSIAATYDPDKLVPIASLSKLVTAIIANRTLDPSQKITISRDIMATYGNTAGFKVGETITVSDLYYPLLMVSSNDAAEALASAVDRKQFLQDMNTFVQSIGAYRTEFEDPSGLSPNNVSTARDLTIILDWIRKNQPNIIAITQLKTKTIRSHTWVNPTHFLSWSNFLGGKNGYTTEADRTAIGLFTAGANKDTYCVVLLGSESRDSDIIKLLKKIK